MKIDLNLATSITEVGRTVASRPAVLHGTSAQPRDRAVAAGEDSVAVLAVVEVARETTV